MKKYGARSDEIEETTQARVKTASESSELDRMPSNAEVRGNASRFRPKEANSNQDLEVLMKAAADAGVFSDSAESPPESEEDLLAKAMKEVDLTKEEIPDIVEKLLLEGEYRESVQVTRNLQVVFRTRTSEEDEELQAKLATLQGTNPAIPRIIQMHNLTCSLVSFKGREFQAVDAKEKFLAGLPSVVIQMLIRRLVRFDQRVLLAMHDNNLLSF